MSKLEQGDYVLATKWHDGEAWDHWCVGFYAGNKNGRHFVVDNEGNQFRANGFRRVEQITKEQGTHLLNNAKEFEQAGARLWVELARLQAEGGGE